MRDCYIGTHVTQNVKHALEEESVQRRMSVSALAAYYLARSVKQPVGLLLPKQTDAVSVLIGTSRVKTGRRPALRVTIDPGFQLAILSSSTSLQTMARRSGFIHQAGFSRVLRTHFPLTKTVEKRLQRLARNLNYYGPLTRP